MPNKLNWKYCECGCACHTVMVGSDQFSIRGRASGGFDLSLNDYSHYSDCQCIAKGVPFEEADRLAHKEAQKLLKKMQRDLGAVEVNRRATAVEQCKKKLEAMIPTGS